MFIDFVLSCIQSKSLVIDYYKAIIIILEDILLSVTALKVYWTNKWLNSSKASGLGKSRYMYIAV